MALSKKPIETDCRIRKQTNSSPFFCFLGNQQLSECEPKKLSALPGKSFPFVQSRGLLPQLPAARVPFLCQSNLPSLKSRDGHTHWVMDMAIPTICDSCCCSGFVCLARGIMITSKKNEKQKNLYWTFPTS